MMVSASPGPARWIVTSVRGPVVVLMAVLLFLVVVVVVRVVGPGAGAVRWRRR
jgi:hypothetical protein